MKTLVLLLLLIPANLTSSETMEFNMLNIVEYAHPLYMPNGTCKE